MFAELHTLSVSLNVEKTGEQLALLAMKALSVEALLQPEGAMRVSGQLGNLTAQDTFTVPSRPYEMLGLRASEQSLLTFEYTVPTETERVAARAAFKCDSAIRVRMSSVQVNYWQAAVMRTVDYLLAGVLGALVSTTASAMVQVAQSLYITGVEEASAMSLDVEVGSPLVLLPTSAGGEARLRADLGRIVVRNQLEIRPETLGRGVGLSALPAEALLDNISVTIEQMQLGTPSLGPALRGRLVQEHMLDEGAALQLHVARGIGSSAERPMIIDGNGDELVCTCSKGQVKPHVRPSRDLRHDLPTTSPTIYPMISPTTSPTISHGHSPPPPPMYHGACVSPKSSRPPFHSQYAHSP